MNTKFFKKIIISAAVLIGIGLIIKRLIGKEDEYWEEFLDSTEFDDEGNTDIYDYCEESDIDYQQSEQPDSNQKDLSYENIGTGEVGRENLQ